MLQGRKIIDFGPNIFGPEVQVPDASFSWEEPVLKMRCERNEGITDQCDQIVFSLFVHLEQDNFAQKHTICAKVSFKLYPKPNKP